MSEDRYERDVRIEFHGSHIVVLGDKTAVYDEADRILRRFQFSAQPYELTEEKDRCVVLTPQPFSESQSQFG